MNRAGEKHALRHQHASASRVCGLVDGLAEGFRVVDLAALFRAEACDLEIAVGEFRRLDAFEDRGQARPRVFGGIGALAERRGSGHREHGITARNGIHHTDGRAVRNVRQAADSLDELNDSYSEVPDRRALE
jgi:hypothetical protein